MNSRWLIIADDLTGAADCAVAFAKRRLSACVVWSDAQDAALQTPVALAIDARSRALDVAAAQAIHRELLQKRLTSGTQVFKKIDSTLRGHPGAEIAALFDVLRAHSPEARIIVAPAFPATGCVTRGAHVYVHGVPLEFTEFWPRGADAAPAHVIHMLESAGISAEPVSLASIRAGESLFRSGQMAAVCDAETDLDLDKIAAACRGPRPLLFVGSAGLAHALARGVSPEFEQRTQATRSSSNGHGLLIVAGSQAQATRTALSELDTFPGIERVTLSPSTLTTPADPGLIEKLAQGTDLAVDLAADFTQVSTPIEVERLARRLAQRVAPLALHASALVATGGETASALFAHCGVTGIRLIDEIEHGITLGLTLGNLAVPVVTKAGGFGDAGSLRRIIERLRLIRRSGTLA